MKKHKYKITISCLIVGVFFFAGVEYSRYKDFYTIGKETTVYKSNGALPKDLDDLAQFFFNVLGHQKSPWTKEQGERILAILRHKKGDAYAFAADVASNRLRFNDPIDPALKKELILTLVDNLSNKDGEIRQISVLAVVHARLALNRTIRTKLESMIYDENPVIANGVMAELEQFDQIEQMRKEGKWHDRVRLYSR